MDALPPGEHAADYEFVIDGRLSERLLHAFPELSACRTEGRTRLHGCLPDAAAVYGVFERCRDLHLDVVAFRRVP